MDCRKSVILKPSRLHSDSFNVATHFIYVDLEYDATQVNVASN